MQMTGALSLGISKILMHIRIYMFVSVGLNPWPPTLIMSLMCYLLDHRTPVDQNFHSTNLTEVICVCLLCHKFLISELLLSS